MRYNGSDTALIILKPTDSEDYLTAFEERHRREFNFRLECDVLVDDVRIRMVVSSQARSEKSPAAQLKQLDLQTTQAKARLLETCLTIDLPSKASSSGSLSLSVIDPIKLTVFSHRFISITEQMGRNLQKATISTNIKQRLDFSYTLFSPDSGLVANTPHVPIHLGSIQFTVHFQYTKWKGNLKDRDVLVSNHPQSGGTHLPDITVITPVFDEPGGTNIVFYIASHGHHADIGGLLPGSMPPRLTELWQEGAAIKGTKLVKNGRFNEARMEELLSKIPGQYKGCSSALYLSNNLSNLQAQIMANCYRISLI
ncbi:hypothetical protein H9Q72_012279 [Fusarium xylarioides]|uniref:Hydantoinase B/oxoprolinase domain-containing protein n=1 Tax=Fusarium xylarioides TaxID=221167 RepID=A0A9P7L3B5_9HYPO|nr:hypothetical protein H9Q72_012279 [Fusarium xylarioides]